MQIQESLPAENGVITRLDVPMIMGLCMVKAEMYIARVVLGIDQGRGVRTDRMKFKQRISIREATQIISNGDAEVDRFNQVIQGMNRGWTSWVKATQPQDILRDKRETNLRLSDSLLVMPTNPILSKCWLVLWSDQERKVSD